MVVRRSGGDASITTDTLANGSSPATNAFAHGSSLTANASTHVPSSGLTSIIREFHDLVLRFETSLTRSLQDINQQPPADSVFSQGPGRPRERVRDEACRMAVAELSNNYARKHLRRSLHHAEAEARRVEEVLLARSRRAQLAVDDDPELLSDIGNGYFRLYSTELFNLLGQPLDLRFGTLRIHRHTPDAFWVSIELALGSSFFVADSLETLPFHIFKMPSSPSLQNRGIRARNPEDHGSFPNFDSWLLFTFLGDGCLKVEIPVELCANVYGGALQGRENEDVQFWGVFVEDHLG